MLLFSTVVVCFIFIEKIIEKQTKQTKLQHRKVGDIHKKKQGERYQQKHCKIKILFFFFDEIENCARNVFKLFSGVQFENKNM